MVVLAREGDGLRAGHGAILGATRLVAPRPVPGVNHGNVGFLVGVEPPALPVALDRVEVGLRHRAAQLHRGDSRYGCYRCDALVLTTPTGSTAYNDAGVDR